MRAILLAAAARAMERVDVRGDGGIWKRVVVAGSGRAPEPLEGIRCAYSGRLSDGSEFDANPNWGFTLGVGEVIKGFDDGVATMRVGERSEFEVRFDYAYGEAGLPGRIPPRATLFFDITLLEIVAAEPRDRLALPESSSTTPPATTVVVVDGEPVKLDALGPVVINKDGTASRITNWPEMTPAEQENTLRIIVKRNRARLAALRRESQEQSRDE
mmetsp:Transcript_12730/g.40373  ORF Transcript_12730/g.40373 Transcript_12730/m.40373 type:complete len:215 (+) Transcript_12730:1-645(+)